MSRQPIGKGERITFILNPANPNEKLILDYFKNSFNRSADIKQILYNYCISNQLSISDNKIIINSTMNDNSIINSLSKNDNSMVNEYTMNDNKISNDCAKNDNIIKEEKKSEKSSSFDINIDSMEDKEIDLSNPIGSEEVTKNAMDFMFNM